MTTTQTAKQFLALDPTTLPSATLDPDADGADAWTVVRLLARGESPRGATLARSLRLRADADGWRDGIVIDLRDAAVRS